MDTDAANAFFSLLAFVAFAIAAAAVLALVVGAISPSARATTVAWSARWWDRSLLIAFVVATVATIGSLYYSQVADLVPCELCWYQRICMYPLVIVLGIGWWRRDPTSLWYAIPLAAVGAGIAGYHVLVERYPSLGSGLSCSVEAPCTVPYFREFGWVTIAVMSLGGFLAIISASVAALVGARADRTMAAA